MEVDDEAPEPTYGDRAHHHLASHTLTARQHRELEPRVENYIKLNGSEKTAYVLESFQLVWTGEPIEWETKALWPSKQENPQWHREKKVCFCYKEDCCGTGRMPRNYRFRGTTASADLPLPWSNHCCASPKPPSLSPLTRTPYVQAVHNFFKEQSQMRNTVVELPGGNANFWTDITVCGEVYKDTIKDLCEDLTEMVAGDKAGWIAEYNKARAAIWFSLSAEEREGVQSLVKTWNRTGIPKEVKKK